MKYQLVCTKCQELYNEKEQVLVCIKCGGRLELNYSHQFDRISRNTLSQRPKGLWRYSEFLPALDLHKIVSLGEGGTPLVKCTRLGQEYGLDKLFLKDETRNPTCSFKDRMSSVGVTKAIEFGVKAVAAETAGNAGASLSAYAAKADLPCFILVTADSPTTIVAKIVVYGATVIKVKATDSEVTELVDKACQEFGWHNIVAAARYNPYVAEGGKTLGYEIVEQLDWVAPDWVVVPVGSGCCLSSAWKGFEEFERLRFSKNLPRMVASQAEGCAPLVSAFKKNEEKIVKWVTPSTIAHSIADDLTADGDTTLDSLRRSGGLAESVTDHEILEAQATLARSEGIFVEPASATTLAVVRKLCVEGEIEHSDTVVVLATGNGLNMPEVVFDYYDKPPEISKNIDQLIRLFNEHT